MKYLKSFGTDEKPTRYYSKKQEDHIAKSLKGNRVPNSGATKFKKGDVELTNWLIECKTRTVDRETFTIVERWLKKNEEEAFAMGKHYSALAFQFRPHGENYYVIDENTFKTLLNYQKEEQKC